MVRSEASRVGLGGGHGLPVAGCTVCVFVCVCVCMCDYRAVVFRIELGRQSRAAGQGGAVLCPKK